MTTKHTPEPVKRYDLALCGTGFHTHQEMNQSEFGDWVRYDDIKPSLDAQHAEIEQMEETIERLWEALKEIVHLGESGNGYTIALNAVNHERRLDAIKEEDEARERFDNGQFGAGA